MTRRFTPAADAAAAFSIRLFAAACTYATQVVLARWMGVAELGAVVHAAARNTPRERGHCPHAPADKLCEPLDRTHPAGDELAIYNAALRSVGVLAFAALARRLRHGPRDFMHRAITPHHSVL